MEWHYQGNMEGSSVRLATLIEPFSKLTLIDISGKFVTDKPVKAINIKYDGELAVWTDPVTDDSSDKNHSFHTRLLLEDQPNTLSLTVEFTDSQETLLGRYSMEEIRNPAIPPKAHWTKRLLRKAINNVTTGDIVSLSKWWGRCCRIAEWIGWQIIYTALHVATHKQRHWSTYDYFVDSGKLTEKDKKELRDWSEQLNKKPVISVLIPVYKPDLKLFRKTVDSVLNQAYPYWQLCIVDDCSQDAKLHKYLRSLSKAYQRIQVSFRSDNGHICITTNEAAGMATGDYLLFLDHDDLLAEDALYEIAVKINECDADIIYSDEDKITTKDIRYDPFFKPGWSPELLLSFNYINHLTCIRKELYDQSGRLRVGFEGAQDYDLLLRATELTNRIAHIPRILYHWRASTGSTAERAGSKEYLGSAAHKALNEAIARREYQCQTYQPDFAVRLGVPIFLLSKSIAADEIGLYLTGNDKDIKQAIEYYASIGIHEHRRLHSDHTIVYSEVSPEGPDSFSDKIRLIGILDCNLRPEGIVTFEKVWAYLQISGVKTATGSVYTSNGNRYSSGSVTLASRRVYNAFEDMQETKVSYYFQAESSRNVNRPGPFNIFIRNDNRFNHAERHVDNISRHVICGDARFLTTAPEDRLHKLVNNHTTRCSGHDQYYNHNLCVWHPYVIRSVDFYKLNRHLSDARRLRYLWATHNLNLNEGAPRCMAERMAAIKSNHGVQNLVYPANSTDMGNCTLSACDIVIIDDSTTQRPSPFRLVKEAIRISSAHRKLGISAVVANTLDSYRPILSNLFHKLPTSWWIHESYDRDLMDNLYGSYLSKSIRKCLYYADSLVFVSHATKEKFASSYGLHNGVVLHNPIRSDLAERHPINKAFVSGKHTRLCNIGYYCERKGQHLLLLAVKELQDRKPLNIRIDCYGGGLDEYYGRYLQCLVKRHKLQQVILHKTTEDVKAILSEVDIYAHSSYIESYCGTTLEAGHFGTQVITSDCDGMQEQALLFDGFTIYKQGNYTELAEAICTALANPTALTNLQKLAPEVDKKNQFEVAEYHYSLINGRVS